MHVEQMESRRLLAVTVALNGGTLTVTGDEANNFVCVQLKDDDTIAVRSGTVTEEEDPGTGTGDGTTPTTAAAAADPHAGHMGPFPEYEITGLEDNEFALADVTSIQIDMGAGNDRAIIGPRVEIDATINGGDGNDHLGGGAGDDTINGGAGNDHIRGGQGADSLNGDDGNDHIDAADRATDTVDGGADTTDDDGTSGDSALIDAADGDTPDTVTNVEATHAIGAMAGNPGEGFPHGPGGPHRGPGGPGGDHRPPGDDDGDNTGTEPGTGTGSGDGSTTTPPADGSTPTTPPPQTGDHPQGPPPGGPGGGGPGGPGGRPHHGGPGGGGPGGGGGGGTGGDVSNPVQTPVTSALRP